MSRGDQFDDTPLNFKPISAKRPPQLNLTICGARSGLSTNLPTGSGSEDDQGCVLEITGQLATDSLSSATLHTEDHSTESVEQAGGAPVWIDIRIRMSEADHEWIHVQAEECGFEHKHRSQETDSAVLFASGPGRLQCFGAAASISSIDCGNATIVPSETSRVRQWLSDAGPDFSGDGGERLRNVHRVLADVSPFLVSEDDEQDGTIRYLPLLEI